jgi:hypothetical protein
LGASKGYTLKLKQREQEMLKLTKKQEQEHIFGRLYDKEKHKLETLKIQPSKISSYKPMETLLIKKAGSNAYELALLHIVLASFKDTEKAQKEMLEKAIQYLQDAEQQEKQMLQQLENPVSNTPALSPPILVLKIIPAASDKE